MKFPLCTCWQMLWVTCVLTKVLWVISVRGVFARSPWRIKETDGDRWHYTLLAWHANINWPFISNFRHFLGVSRGTIILAGLPSSAFFFSKKHKAPDYHFNLVPLVCFWKTTTVKHVCSPPVINAVAFPDVTQIRHQTTPVMPC